MDASTFPLVSADSHVNEPRRLWWDGLPASMRERAPARIVPDNDGSYTMWGSDYPHGEGTYPHSRKVVREMCDGLPEADARAVVGGTAIELFGFDPEAIATVCPPSLGS